MREIFAAVIRKGGYDLAAMLRRIDEYHIEGKLADGEREELIGLARGDAAPQVDPAGEVQRLWAAVRDLTARVAALEAGGTQDGSADEDDIRDYAQPTGAHDAYYTGDVVRYEGKIYECVAPAAAACVWSPAEMPSYWQVTSND